MDTFEAEGLSFRPFESGDAPFVLDMWSREEIWRYSGGPSKALHTLEKAVERIASFAALHTRPGTGVWLASTADGPVGRGIVRRIPLSDDAADVDPFTGDADVYEVGWHIHPDLWGRGYATAVGKACVKHAARHGIERPIAVTHADNKASQAVALKVGMTANGVCDRYYNQPVQHFHLAQDALTLDG